MTAAGCAPWNEFAEAYRTRTTFGSSIAVERLSAVYDRHYRKTQSVRFPNLCLNSRPITIRRASILCSLTILVLLLCSDTAPAQTSCDNLKNLTLPNTTITLAQSLPAGSNPAPVGNLPTY